MLTANDLPLTTFDMELPMMTLYEGDSGPEVTLLKKTDYSGTLSWEPYRAI